MLKCLVRHMPTHHLNSLFQSGSLFRALNFHILCVYIPSNAIISAFQVRNAGFLGLAGWNKKLNISLELLPKLLKHLSTCKKCCRKYMMCLEGCWTSQLICKLETEITLDMRLCAMSALRISVFSSSGGKGCLHRKILLKELSCDNVFLLLHHQRNFRRHC